MARSDATPKVRVTRENLVALPALAPYFVFALLAFVALPFFLMGAAHALEAGFYRNPRVLALLHVGALGWGTSVALGALQQMTAVVGATQLYSTRLAAVAFIPFAAGVVALIRGFYSFSPVALSGAAVGVPVGVALVLFNVRLTMRGARPTRRWQLIVAFVKDATLYVMIAFVAGAALALNLTRGTLGTLWNGVFPLHIGLAGGGWFLMLVLGISYHLLTFFGLVDKGHTFRFIRAVRPLLHCAIWLGIVAAAFPALITDSVTRSLLPMKGDVVVAGIRTTAMFALITALALFLWDSKGLYARPKRQRTDVVGTYVRVAHIYLGLFAGGLFVATLGPLGGPLAALGTIPLFYIVLGILLGAGWLANTILGYFHRILAFFVWHNKYWGRGREPGVPPFRDMVNAPLAGAGLVVYNVGVVGSVICLGVGLPLDWAALTWAVGAVLVAVNLLWTLLR